MKAIAANIRGDLATFQIFFTDWILNRDSASPRSTARNSMFIVRSASREGKKNNTSRNAWPISSLRRIIASGKGQVLFKKALEPRSSVQFSIHQANRQWPLERITLNKYAWRTGLLKSKLTRTRSHLRSSYNDSFVSPLLFLQISENISE